MKKFFIVSLLIAMFGAFNNCYAQSQTQKAGSEKGVLVSGSISLCTYDRACLITDNDMQLWTQKFEVSYDSSVKRYGVYIKCHGDIINLDIKYTGNNDGVHSYKGTDLMTGRQVVVMTKQKLSSYLRNNGVNYPSEVESSKGIIVTVPSTYTVFSIVSMKNK